MTGPCIDDIELSIVMPCLNEAETLERCIIKALTWLEKWSVSGEVIIGDNGSTDGSQAIAAKCGARVIPVTQRGYGSALYHASKAAKGKFIIMGDSDNSYDFGTLEGFLERLRGGCDLVMGNRFSGGIEKLAMPWKNRYIGNPILSGIGRILYNCPSHDFHCGLRGYSKDAFQRMDMRTTGMEFASEMVIKATMFGMRIEEVPTTLSKDGRSRPPHLRPWRDGWRHLRFMLLLSPRWLFLIPGLAMLIPNLTLFLVLLAGPVKIGAITLDVHSLLVAGAAAVVGCMTISFGLIVRLFGMREGLLPEHGMLDRLRHRPVVEVGGGAGALMTVGGAIGMTLSVVSWGRHGFGPLQPTMLVRSIAVSALFLQIGALTLATSLIIGFLALPTRRVEEIT